MAIDRTTFLLLVGTLAASACGDDNEVRGGGVGGTSGAAGAATAGKGGGAQGGTSTGGRAGAGGRVGKGGSAGASGTAGEAGDGGMGGLTTGGEGGDNGQAGGDEGGAAGQPAGGNAGISGQAGSAGNANGGTSGQAGSAGSSGHAGGGAGGLGAGGSAGSAGSAGDGGEAGAGACDDAQGALANCATVLTDCGAYGEYWCQRGNINLKPRIARTTAACMLANIAMSCGPPPTCMRESLAEACPDPSADTACADYVVRCSPAAPLTDTECHEMVDGLNSTGRASLQACVDSNDCQYGLWPCFEGL